MSNLQTTAPMEVRRVGRYGVGLIRDLFERGTGHRDQMLPPHRLRFVGHGDFKMIGEETVRQLVDLATTRASNPTRIFSILAVVLDEWHFL